MPSALAANLQKNIANHLDEITQVQAGSEINTLIQDISKVKFEDLAKEQAKDRGEKYTIKKVKFSFAITSVCLAVITVILSIASVLFATGMINAGTQTLAVVTGFVGIPTAFNQLDQAIFSCIKLHNENASKETRISRLAKRVNEAAKLIEARINTLDDLKEEKIKIVRCREIFKQIERVNGLIRRIRKNLPEKISAFPVINPAPLLKYTMT